MNLSLLGGALILFEFDEGANVEMVLHYDVRRHKDKRVILG